MNILKKTLAAIILLIGRLKGYGNPFDAVPEESELYKEADRIPKDSADYMEVKRAVESYLYFQPEASVEELYARLSYSERIKALLTESKERIFLPLVILNDLKKAQEGCRA